MIKKICLILVCALIVFATYTVVVNGTTIVDIPKFTTFKEKNTQLDSKIQTINNLNTVQYNAKKSQIVTAQADFKTAKETYDELVKNSSVEQIREANQEENYLLEFLWIRLGNYARDNNVKARFDTITESAELSFVISGSYISVINFVYDIENDADLKFNVDNIKISPDELGVVAKFTVSGIDVVTQ